MKARLATAIGKVALSEYSNKCSKAPADPSGVKNQGRHEKMFLGENNWKVVTDGPWICDCCGEVFEVGTASTIYDTPSGHLEPGCLYWDDTLAENHYWDNHKGPHLSAILPTGAHWNIDSRASNCKRKNDRTTRCWRRSGEPPNVHTSDCGCGAGAGSIMANQGTPQEWHGYLHHGEFHK